MWENVNSKNNFMAYYGSILNDNNDGTHNISTDVTYSSS